MLTRGRPDRPLDWASLPVHPILIGAYPVLFLFAENAVQQVTLAPLWLPLGLAVGAAVVALLVLRLLLGDWVRAALLASLALILFFGFGHAWNLLADALGRRLPLVVVWGTVLVVGAALIVRGGGWQVPLTRFLNVVGIVAVGFNLVRLGDFVIDAGGATTSEAASVAVEIDPANIERRPDIYYIILDRYANAETLRRIYNYDNSPFLDELERRGFYVADDSFANYWKTAFSLYSSLNMEHLDGEALDDGDPPTFGPLHRGLRDHLRVPATLKSLGYEYVHIGTWFEPTSTNVDADRTLLFAEHSEFATALIGTTLVSILTPLEDPAPEEVTSGPLEPDAYREMTRNNALFAFERLDEVAERPGPTYVFAHFLVPHAPYAFDLDGSVPTREEFNERTDEQEYVIQLRWANGRLLESLDRLMDVPAGEEPVVIVQADEGPLPPRFEADQNTFQWLEATHNEIQQKFGILNALHLPGVDPAGVGLHERISPVNAFRVVFNAYFGTELELLPDVTYLSPDVFRMYDFVPLERTQ